VPVAVEVEKKPALPFPLAKPSMADPLPLFSHLSACCVNGFISIRNLPVGPFRVLQVLINVTFMAAS